MTLNERIERAVMAQKSCPHGMLSPFLAAFKRAKEIVEQNTDEHKCADCIVVEFDSRKVYWLTSLSAVDMYRGDYATVDDMVKMCEEDSSLEEIVSTFEMQEHEAFCLCYCKIDKVIFLLGKESQITMHLDFVPKDEEDEDLFWDTMYTDYLALLQNCYRSFYKGIDKENRLIQFDLEFF